MRCSNSTNYSGPTIAFLKSPSGSISTSQIGFGSHDQELHLKILVKGREKFKRFLTSLQQRAHEISPEAGRTIRSLTLDLVNNVISVTQFGRGIEETLEIVLKTFIHEFVKEQLPDLRREIQIYTRDIKKVNTEAINRYPTNGIIGQVSSIQHPLQQQQRFGIPCKQSLKPKPQLAPVNAGTSIKSESSIAKSQRPLKKNGMNHELEKDSSDINDPCEAWKMGYHIAWNSWIKFWYLNSCALRGLKVSDTTTTSNGFDGNSSTANSNNFTGRMVLEKDPMVLLTQTSIQPYIYQNKKAGKDEDVIISPSHTSNSSTPITKPKFCITANQAKKKLRKAIKLANQH